MTWKDTLSIGIPEIDKQHKELCDHIDRLYTAGSQGKSADEAIKILEFLEQYTIKHFAQEEKLQREINYPKYNEHKEMHTKFINKIADLKKDMVETGATIALIININQTISDWLVKHIMTVDKDLKKFIK